MLNTLDTVLSRRTLELQYRLDGTLPACTLLWCDLTYLPHPNPSFALGSRLDRQWYSLRGYRPFTPRPSAGLWTTRRQTNSPADQLADNPTRWQSNLPTTNSPTDQLADNPTRWQSNSPTDQLTDKQTHCNWYNDVTAHVEM